MFLTLGLSSTLFQACEAVIAQSSGPALDQECTGDDDLENDELLVDLSNFTDFLEEPLLENGDIELVSASNSTRNHDNGFSSGFVLTSNIVFRNNSPHTISFGIDPLEITKNCAQISDYSVLGTSLSPGQSQSIQVRYNESFGNSTFTCSFDFDVTKVLIHSITVHVSDGDVSSDVTFSNSDQELNVTPRSATVTHENEHDS